MIIINYPMSNRKERRKQKRYSAKAGAIAILKPFYNMIGPIINISKGGLAFYYYPSEEYPDIEECVELKIISESYNVFIEGIKVHIISNVEYIEHFHDSKSTMMRCGLQFHKLDHSSKTKIEKLISKIKGQNQIFVRP